MKSLNQIQSEFKEKQESDSMKPLKKLFTLVFIKKNNSVLLGLKTRGLGKGLWNGFGGKVEKHETVNDCAKRELEEECHVVAKDLKQIGVVRYDLNYNNSADVVHIFTCSNFEGLEKASEEMNPIKWYDFDKIPFVQMWPDCKDWYPSMLSDKYFSARVVYSDENTIKSRDIQEYNNLASALKLIQ